MNPIVDVEQGSVDWLQMRVGCATASRVAAIIKERKKGNGDLEERKNYKAEVICERLTGLAFDHYVSPAMEWGMQNEDLAKAAYEIETGAEIEPGGLAFHPTIKFFAASPDGLIGDDGLIECKCPQSGTHIDYLLAGVVPEQYQPQMLAQMACTGRKWCDFVSFDPRMPKGLQLFVRRFPRDDDRIRDMETKVEQFLREVDEQIAKLKECKCIDLNPETLQRKLEETLARVGVAKEFAK